MGLRNNGRNGGSFECCHLHVHGLSVATRINLEIKVSWDATSCRVVVADVSSNHNYYTVETAQRLKSLERAATLLGETRIS